MTLPFIPLLQPHHFFNSTQKLKVLTGANERVIEVVQFSLPNFSDQLFTLTNLHFPQTIRTSVISRQAEYFATRYVVAKCMQNYGYDNFQLLNDHNRVPRWPEHILGSISHSDHLAAVMISAKSNQGMESIGVDIQTKISPEVAKEVSLLVIAPEELATMKEFGLTDDEAVSLIFSAKESIYKALNQHSPIELDFQSVSLVKIDNQRLIFEPAVDLGNHMKAIQTLYCDYRYLEEYRAYLTACHFAW